MKTVQQSLIDYELTLLQAIAECRGAPLATLSKQQAVETLAEALRSPAQTEIVLADLSPAEYEALQFLVENGGQVEGPRFMRRYGVIRLMGPGRMTRERPWQNPANPAEGLWYRGLIFKTFQITPEGNVEVIYIPVDLLPLLGLVGNIPAGSPEAEPAGAAPASPPALDPHSPLQVALAPTPAYVINGVAHLRESFFSLLVYLQTKPVRLKNKEQLTPQDRSALIDSLPPSLWSGITSTAAFDFLFHLARRAGLLAVTQRRLRPEREPVRAWLQASEAEQLRQLQQTWRADPTWNDLWHVPGLAPHATGWDNSPLLARSKILDHLAQLSSPVESWFSITDFIDQIKLHDPDFQRPDGNYESWYLYDTDNRPLMGFEHWDQVEGELIHYLLVHILLLLGVTELGFASPGSEPIAFRLTPQGQAFLLDQPVAPETRRPMFFRVGPNLQVQAPLRASLYDRFQLARFAELIQREENRAVYQLTQASVSRALHSGITADQMVAFLNRASNNQTPLKVVETLRNWGRRQGGAEIERVTLLRLKHEALLEEIRQHPQLRPLLGEILSPTTIIVAAEHIAEVRRLLTELGYLAE